MVSKKAKKLIRSKLAYIVHKKHVCTLLKKKKTQQKLYFSKSINGFELHGSLKE